MYTKKHLKTDEKKSKHKILNFQRKTDAKWSPALEALRKLIL
jgi:hypothetical protein